VLVEFRKASLFSLELFNHVLFVTLFSSERVVLPASSASLRAGGCRRGPFPLAAGVPPPLHIGLTISPPPRMPPFSDSPFMSAW